MCNKEINHSSVGSFFLVCVCVSVCWDKRQENAGKVIMNWRCGIIFRSIYSLLCIAQIWQHCDATHHLHKYTFKQKDKYIHTFPNKCHKISFRCSCICILTRQSCNNQKSTTYKQKQSFGQCTRCLSLPNTTVKAIKIFQKPLPIYVQFIHCKCSLLYISVLILFVASFSYSTKTITKAIAFGVDYFVLVLFSVRIPFFLLCFVNVKHSNK